MKFSFIFELVFIFYNFIQLVHSQYSIQAQITPDDRGINVQTNYTLKLTLDRNIPASSMIKLSFQNSEISFPSSNLTVCQMQIQSSSQFSPTSYHQCYVENQFLYIPLHTQIVLDGSNNQLMTIKIGLLKNPPFIKAQNIYVQLIYNLVPPQDSHTLISIVTSMYVGGEILEPSLIQSSYLVGATNTYTISFKISNQIRKFGKVFILFPSQIQLVASPTINAQIYESSFIPAIYEKPIQQNQVIITNLFQTNDLNPKMDSFIVIKIDGVQNPTSQMQSDGFGIITTTLYNEPIDQLQQLYISVKYHYLIS